MQLLDQEGSRAPIRLHPIARPRASPNCRKEAFVEDLVLVGALSQALQSGAGEEIVLVDLPEIWRATAVLIRIAVVIGPDAVACGVENVTAKTFEAELDQHVEFLLADAGDGIIRKALEILLGDGNY